MEERELLYWNNYLNSISYSNENEPYVEASIAGDLSLADELLNLYLSGAKTAGSSLVKDFMMAGDELPKVGNHWIVLDSKEEPKCILKTVRVERFLFKDITAEIAKAEGEGDLSINTWKEKHRNFFTPFLKDLNIENLDEAEVITEFYEVVYKGSVSLNLTI